VVGPARETVLDGISLRVTEELCAATGIPFVASGIPRSRSLAGAEGLLTGTGFGIAGIRELFSEQPEPVVFTWVGPILRRLLAAWSDLVGIDIARQLTESP
jgi:branched-subunit amino acid aminotransferase/4-amino-4-deoxychorismate lyase